MVKCGDWGWGPNPYSSHINAIYIYIWCLATFKCCGCAYGCVSTTLRPLMPTKLLEFCYKSGQLPPKNSLWNAVIEAVDPTHIHLTTMLYIYIRCLTTFICCGCAYGCVPTTLRPLMPTKLLEFCYKSGQLPPNNSWWNAVIERLRTQPIFISDQCYIYIYIRCLTTFICCGCAYGCVSTTLQPLMPTTLLEFCYKSGQLPPNTSWWNVAIERLRTQPIFISHQCYMYIYIKGVWQPLYAVDVHMDVSQQCYSC